MGRDATQNPIIFCPNPTVTATDKTTKSTYIPCSTDYITMKGLVDKTKIKKKYPWSKVNKPKVMAIPLSQFINTLRTSEDDNVKEIKVIPTPSSLKVINQVNSNKNKYSGILDVLKRTPMRNLYNGFSMSLLGFGTFSGCLFYFQDKIKKKNIQN